ncbi:DUF4178 domain-containing protein [Flavobacterium sp.]|uniref:DUF4178 domain-containing protein n=1 Tax=Flavobacterium sp. TaxID=239 RepID=UPI0039E56BAA
MEVPCSHCHTVTKLDVAFEVKHFVCPNCQSVFRTNQNGLLVYAGKKLQHQTSFSKGLEVGQKGTLKGTEYTVVGIIVKKAYGSFYWTEYTLQDASGNFRYLSDSEEHWIFLEEVPEKYEVGNRPRLLTHDDIRMRLYHHTKVDIVGAKGFFDVELALDGGVFVIEYINPPFIVSIERMGKEEVTFFGEHISRREVMKAFGLGRPMHMKVGTGIVQPFLVNLRSAAIILCSVAILIFVTHMFVYSGRRAETVMQTTFTITDSNNRQFVSNPFTLQGGSAPLTVVVDSDIDNSWLNVDVALVNELTNEEVYANKDVEYYHGYEGGESWSEGDKSETLQLCGVTAGKYHLIVTPMWAPENGSNNYMQVKAIWNNPSMWNAWFPIIIMGVTLLILYLLNLNFEKKRWSESDYSPYEE